MSDRNIPAIRLKELANILIKRKYPIQITRSGIIEALHIPNINKSIQNKKFKTDLILYYIIPNHNRYCL